MGEKGKGMEWKGREGKERDRQGRRHFVSPVGIDREEEKKKNRTMHCLYSWEGGPAAVSLSLLW